MSLPHYVDVESRVVDMRPLSRLGNVVMSGRRRNKSPRTGCARNRNAFKRRRLLAQAHRIASALMRASHAVRLRAPEAD
jgi:hypothetical protein